MIYSRILDFYTHHAVLWPALSILKMLPSTYSIALFVFIFGTILQVYHCGNKSDGTVRQKIGLFIFHSIPLFLVPYLS